MKEKKPNVTIGDSFETIGAEHKWIGQEVEVKSDPFVDEGSGATMAIRVFDFAANPKVLKDMKPTKQDLFNHHVKQIETMLWADGLKPVHHLNPIIQVSKKREKYRIYVTCEAKKGNMFSYKDKPQTLQQIIKPNAT